MEAIHLFLDGFKIKIVLDGNNLNKISYLKEKSNQHFIHYKRYTMPYFDFHIHPTLKSLFSEDDPSQNLRKNSPYNKIDTNRIPWPVRWCSEFKAVLSSQSNMEQLFRNQVRLFGFPLFIPDTALMDNNLVKKSPSTTLGVYLHKDQIDKLIRQNPYQNLINEDLPVLLDSIRFGMGHRTVKVLAKRSDFKEDKLDQIHVFFTLEGLHTLCDEPNVFDIDVIKRNLDDLLNRVPVLSATITHIQKSDLCNHADAIQFLNDDRFFPNGFGINQDGFKMIEHLHAKKIQIDVKHMSMLSRKRYYDHYRQKGWTAPVICTHAGLTGISWNDIHRYIGRTWYGKKKQGVIRLKYAKPRKYGSFFRPGFNMVSLNLFDEDVLFILKSGGMIGLSLDKRILGFSEYETSSSREDFPNNVEFVSVRAWSQYKTGSNLGTAIRGRETLTWGNIKDGGLVDPQLGEYHLEYFMQQIAHIIAVARSNNYSVHKAMKQICIGSDFDGLINPIWCCDSMDEIEQFKIRFRNHFVKFCQDSGVVLPVNFSVNKFAEDLFYHNGKAYVLDRL